MNVEHFVQFLVENYGWIAAIMSVIVYLVMEALKFPVKKLTSLIKVEKLRKLANKSIIVLTFCIAFLVDYLGSVILPEFVTFDTLISSVIGFAANCIYAILEGLITPSTLSKKAEELKAASDTGDATVVIEAGTTTEETKTIEAPKKVLKKQTKVSKSSYKEASKSEAMKNFDELTK